MYGRSVIVPRQRILRTQATEADIGIGRSALDIAAANVTELVEFAKIIV